MIILNIKKSEKKRSCVYFKMIFIFRNLDVGEDNEIGEGEDEDEGERDLVTGLHCKIVVQFEDHKDFYNALKVLCGRSLNKVGSYSLRF